LGSEIAFDRPNVQSSSNRIRPAIGVCPVPAKKRCSSTHAHGHSNIGDAPGNRLSNVGRDAFPQQVLTSISIVNANPYTQNAFNPDVAGHHHGLSDQHCADRGQSGEPDLGAPEWVERDGCASRRTRRREYAAVSAVPG
jgi:hypothetical protein